MSGAGDVLNEMPIEDCGRLLTLAFAGLQEMCGHSSGCDHYFLPVRALVQALEFGIDDLVEQREKAAAEFPAQRESESAPASVTPEPPAGPESQEPAKVRQLRPA
jgi:hypothetical protein